MRILLSFVSKRKLFANPSSCSKAVNFSDARLSFDSSEKDAISPAMMTSFEKGHADTGLSHANLHQGIDKMGSIFFETGQATLSFYFEAFLPACCTLKERLE